MNPQIETVDFNERPFPAIWDVTLTCVLTCDLACVHCRAAALAPALVHSPATRWPKSPAVHAFPEATLRRLPSGKPAPYVLQGASYFQVPHGKSEMVVI